MSKEKAKGRASHQTREGGLKVINPKAPATESKQEEKGNVATGQS